jgi:hypothetical protein
MYIISLHTSYEKSRIKKKHLLENPTFFPFFNVTASYAALGLFGKALKTYFFFLDISELRHSKGKI